MQDMYDRSDDIVIPLCLDLPVCELYVEKAQTFFRYQSPHLPYVSVEEVTLSHRSPSLFWHAGCIFCLTTRTVPVNHLG